MGQRNGKTRVRLSRIQRKNSWTTTELGLLKRSFADQPTAVLAKKLGRRVDAVKKKASRMRLKKSRSYMKMLGRS